MFLFSKRFKKLYFKTFVFTGVILLTFLFLINYIYNSGQKKSKALDDSVELSFSAISPMIYPSEPVVTIKAKPNVDLNIRGYKFNLTFNNSVLEVKDITYRLGVLSAGLADSNSTLAAVNTAGKIKIQGEIQTAAGQIIPASLTTDVISVKFAIKSSQVTNVSIDTGGNFTKINTDFSLLNVPTSSSGDLIVNGTTPSATPISGIPGESPAAGNVTLNLKLKLQGILSKPQGNNLSIPIKVTIVSASGTKTELPGTATYVDPEAIWTANIPANQPAGSKYKVFVKGPKHVQKRICDNTPTETFPGSYHCDIGNITLQAGTNTLDFSGIYMLVGDLPKQDGVVNSYDISLVRNNIGSKDPAVLGLADLNLDGIVDSQDYSLVIAALSIRSDEGE